MRLNCRPLVSTACRRKYTRVDEMLQAACETKPETALH